MFLSSKNNLILTQYYWLENIYYPVLFKKLFFKFILEQAIFLFPLFPLKLNMEFSILFFLFLKCNVNIFAAKRGSDMIIILFF